MCVCVCVCVCPHCPLCLKQLYKAVDFVFEVPVGTPGWPTGMHEPLLIGVLFHFSAPNHGNSGTHQSCSLLREVCTNFGCSVGGWELCQKMWCGDWYSAKASPSFFAADEEQILRRGQPSLVWLGTTKGRSFSIRVSAWWWGRSTRFVRVWSLHFSEALQTRTNRDVGVG